MNNRFLEMRKSLGLSQEKLGNSLGVTRSAVSNMETGRFGITDTMIKLICSKFNVNEEWLRYGIGDMFTAKSDTFIDELAQKYGLGHLFKQVIESYFSLNELEKKVIEDFLEKIVNSYGEKK